MRDLKQFLPARFQTNKIANFIESTTNSMFSEKDATKSTYFIGKTPAGIFNPEKDYYLNEIKKIREDYQLEPSLVIKNSDSNEAEAILNYEDMLNALAGMDVDTTDHKRIFDNKKYSFAPPIDIDMFINNRDYYWYPEGIPAIELNTLKSDIVGKATVAVEVTETGESIQLTSGMHVIVEGTEYIVEGVGRYITLEQFNFTQNIPLRVTLADVDENDVYETYDLFPKEYITMERGAHDKNPWSRNNAWYHKDAITFKIGSVKFKPDNARKATRPIICFDKDIQLSNYSENHFMNVDLYGMTGAVVDGITVSNGMTVLEENNNVIYRMNNGSLTPMHTLVEGQKVTIANGKTNAGKEFYVKDGAITQAQVKHKNTQAIKFLTNEGESEIFGYSTNDEYGSYDPELQMNIEYKAFKESSDIVFRNYLYNSNALYKKINYNDISNNIIKFTIDNYNGNKTIYVNGEPLPTLVLYADKEYLFDFSDGSTTPDSIFGSYTPISIVDSFKNPVIKATTKHNKVNRVSTSFAFSPDSNMNKYEYTDGKDVYGQILIIENTNSNVEWYGAWKESTREIPKLYHREVVSGGSLELEYNPSSDDEITIINNGEEITDYTRNKNIINFDSIDNDFVEVIYKTNENVSHTYNTIQTVHTALSNNAYNDDVESFAYSEIFNHFISIIRNQPYLEGTPLSNNNYRDTIKDNSLGDVITQHDISVPTLMFMLHNDKYNFYNALMLAEASYSNYKANIITYTQDFMRNYDINQSNVHDVFDEIMGIINSSKTNKDPYVNTYMFGTFKKFINITLDDNGYITDADVKRIYNNTLYVYTNEGIKNIDIDFEFNEANNQIIPKTFSFDDIAFIRYYEDLEPSFCPATPSKLGLSAVFVPQIVKDDTYLNPAYFIVGHDGSRTLCYSSNEDIEAGIFDARDLIMLEFEKRIYNGIEPYIKNSEVMYSIEELKEGKFRSTKYTKEYVRQLEYKAFHRWALENNIQFEVNDGYVDNNPFTYNYSHSVDLDNQELDGNWKAIYTYYYDTYRPHSNPWEMLGFKFKPEWFDSEYGTDYSSNNTYLWYDLEQGIIRKGDRENVTNDRYYQNNIYRRVGLSSYIPVDENGNLKNPIEIGLTTKPTYFSAKDKWKFGDFSPAELAWRNSSDYKFTEQRIKFALNPLTYVSRAWDVAHSYNNEIIRPRNLRIHSNDDYVVGISQWIIDYMRHSKLSLDDNIIKPFYNQNIQMAYKVGGFIDESELIVSSESFSPRNENTSNLIPREDISVLTHESKDFKQESYSGVIIERVSDNTEIKPFVDGSTYNFGDVVRNLKDNLYYKYEYKENIPEWKNGTYYIIGRKVTYKGIQYECVTDHRASLTLKPDVSEEWVTQKFNLNEWMPLKEIPKSKNTIFRVVGFDPYQTNFTIIPSDPNGTEREVKVTTRSSKPIPVSSFASGMDVKEGQHVILSNGKRVRFNKAMKLGDTVDSSAYTVVDSNNVFSGMTSAKFKTSPFIKNGSLTTASVPYGTRFKTIEEVVQFLHDYGAYLEHKGWKFDNRDGKDIVDWVYSIKDFLQWQYETKDEGSALFISPAADGVKFIADHGVVSVKRDMDQGNISLINQRGEKIDFEKTEALRINNEFTLKAEEPIYFCRVDVREYEHILTISNSTIFNDVIYNPLFNIRKDRLIIKSLRSNNWDGRLRADGFIIVGNKVYPNFDTSIKDMSTIMDVEDVSTQDILNSLKYHNIGFQPRSYLSELEMDDKTQVRFFKGFIRNKGTSESFQRLLRTEALGSNIELKIAEEWAFKEGSFGGVNNNQFIEIVLDDTDIKSTPQNILFEYQQYNFANKKSSNVYVNINDEQKWVKRPTYYADNGMFVTKPLSDVKKLPTAGYVNPDSVDLMAFNISDIDGEISNTDTTITKNSIIWVADNELSKNGWDVFYVDDSGLTITDLVTKGKDKSSSFVVGLSGSVDQNAIYGIYMNGENHTFRFKHIEDNYYIALSTKEGEFNILVAEPSTIYKLKSLRTKGTGNNDLTIINDLITTNQINLFNGIMVFVDNSVAGGWKVYEYNSGTWTVKNQEQEVIDTSMIDGVLVYDKESNIIINNLNIHDPIKGMFSGSSSNHIDYMTTYDPANYNSETGYSSWGIDYVGKLWLDTSKLRYVEYENGDEDFKSKFWGALFPNSEVNIYEWTKSSTKPSEGKYVTFKEYNNKTGIENTFYYFWTKNPSVSPANSTRKVSAVDIANSIRYPENNGIPFVTIMGNSNLAIYDVNNTISQKDTVLQISYQLSDSASKTHNQWTLVQEGEDYDDIPEFLFNKMIDSIIGYDVEERQVPDPLLSEIQKYGNLNQPRQSWFKNIKEARRIFLERMNDILLKINVWDVDLFWERKVEGVLRETDVYHLVDWYHESFDSSTTITNLVNTRHELMTTYLEDGDIVKVQERVGRMPSVYDRSWTVYRYLESDNTYQKVAQNKSTLQFKEDIFKVDIDLELGKEVRKIIDIIFDYIILADFKKEINEMFFSLVRYVFVEQPTNDWVFPTTFISVLQRSQDLVKIPTYQRSKEEQLKAYITEAKPFHTKIRAYNHIHEADDEYIGLQITDFDKPPFITNSRNVVNIQEKVISKVRAKQGVKRYELDEAHNNLSSVKVYVNGRIIQPSEYAFTGKTLIFTEPPALPVNHVENIVVESIYDPHMGILLTYDKTRGQKFVLDKPLDTWKELVNQKHTTIAYDRISNRETMTLERMKQIYESSQTEQEPMAAFTKLSNKTNSEPFTEFERVACFYHKDEVDSLVANSTVIKVTNKKKTFIGKNLDKDNVVLIIDNRVISTDYYNTSNTGNDVKVTTLMYVYPNQEVIIRPKGEYESFLEGINNQEGVVYSKFVQLSPRKESQNGFINVDSENNVIVSTVEEVGIAAQDYMATGENGDFIMNTDGFDPEEYVGLRMNESITFTYNNNLKVERRAYDTALNFPIFDTIIFNASGETSTPIDLGQCKPDQLLVIINDDEWSLGLHYSVDQDKINWIRPLPNGQKVIITDRVAAFDPYMGRYVPHVNIEGFDGNYIVPDSYNDQDDWREVVIYDGGRVINMIAKVEVDISDDIIYNETKISIVDDKLNGITQTSKRLAMLRAENSKFENGQIVVTDSIIEFVMIDNYDGSSIEIHRGLFGQFAKDFKQSDYDTVKLHLLEVSNTMDSFTITEPYIGINGKTSYPKYGRVITGKD